MDVKTLVIEKQMISSYFEPIESRTVDIKYYDVSDCVEFVERCLASVPSPDKKVVKSDLREGFFWEYTYRISDGELCLYVSIVRDLDNVMYGKYACLIPYRLTSNLLSVSENMNMSVGLDALNLLVKEIIKGQSLMSLEFMPAKSYPYNDSEIRSFPESYPIESPVYLVTKYGCRRGIYFINVVSGGDVFVDSTSGDTYKIKDGDRWIYINLHEEGEDDGWLPVSSHPSPETDINLMVHEGFYHLVPAPFRFNSEGN